MWDVTLYKVIFQSRKEFLLTHPVWDVTEYIVIYLIQIGISTHTSRVGCDVGHTGSGKSVLIISTHTSRVGCDRI